MRIVAALGGNALLRRGEPLTAERQRRNVARAIEALAPLGREHALVVTHGNGPQVGLLALQAAAVEGGSPWPLDVLGAESEGMIGYLLEQALGNALPGRPIATLLTQVVVDPEDAAFRSPSKPIGPLYAEPVARRLAAERGWAIARDSEGWRRVVASPEPRRIVELSTIRLLVEAGVLVVCAGGGGIPVVEGPAGELRGIEAVIDKDLAAALLAEGLGASVLLLLTDVAAVYRGGTATGEAIGEITAAELRRVPLPPGSMGPKAEAACRFVERTGGRAAIGALEDAVALVAGSAGTQVLAERGERVRSA
ncbi:MAG: carbamate kinase [Thermoleophilia bacterium]|nr:carbamate kinase [Gaiellaceae bacterium]MDW8338596.1 carbamate kinase [Thermoleophilia bacterium]